MIIMPIRIIIRMSIRMSTKNAAPAAMNTNTTTAKHAPAGSITMIMTTYTCRKTRMPMAKSALNGACTTKPV
jgi:hypothetical protein